MSNVRLVRGALCLLVLACSLVSTSHAAVVALKRDTGLTAGGATDARFNSATVVTTTVADAGIYTSGNARWMNAGRCDRPANAAYMLYKFDLSSIPAGSTINLAQLRLYHTAGNGGQGNGDVSVVLTHDWTEGPGTTDMISYPGAAGGVSYAHFNGRNTDAFQDANGGTTGPQQTWSASSNAWFDITIDAGSPLAPSSTPTGTGYHVIPVTSHVQQWVSGIRPNYGWAQIRGYWDFHCSEAGTALEPVLFVDYTPGSTISFSNNTLTYGAPSDLGTTIDPPGLADVTASYGLTKAAFQALNPQVVPFNNAPAPTQTMLRLVANYTTSGTVTFTFPTGMYNYGGVTTLGRSAFSGSATRDDISTLPNTVGSVTDWFDATITTTGGQGVKALGFCVSFRNDQAVAAGQALFTLSDATTATVTLPALGGGGNPQNVFIGYQAPTGQTITRVQASRTSTIGGAWVAIDDLSFVMIPLAGDTTAPAAITNLATSAASASSVTLTWTAPGDDASTGTATTYDIRYSTSTITDANWASATQVTGEPTPAAAGTAQNMTVSGLSGDTTYYFAMKTSDEVPNTSALSNVVNRKTSDTVAPAAVANLAAGTPTGTSLAVTWTAPGDNGSTGTAASYDLRYSTSTITDANWASATQVSGEPTPATASTNQSMTVSGLTSDTTYYFAIKTNDEVPNASALSNVPSGKTSDVTAPAAVANLAAGSATTSSLTLTWTAPGDSGSTGTAAAYDIRYSTSTITDANWASATQVTGEPTPAAAGTAQNMTVSGLSASTTYYFATKTSDEVPNTSALSNVPSGTTTAASQGPVTILHTGSNISGWRGGINVSASYCWIANWPNSNADGTLAEFDRTGLQNAINTTYNAYHGWDAKVVVTQVDWVTTQPPAGIGPLVASVDIDRDTLVWGSSICSNAGNGNWKYNGTSYADFVSAVNAGVTAGASTLVTNVPYTSVWDTALPTACWDVVIDVPESLVNAYLQNASADGLFVGAQTTAALNIFTGSQWSHQANVRVVVQQPPQTAPWIGLDTFLISKTIALTSPTATQVVNVTNAATGTLSWTAAENPDVSWLTITNGSGTNSGSFTANFNVTGLTAGNTYTTKIRLAATGATNTPQDINVSVKVVANTSPTIQLSPTSLSYDMSPSDTASGQPVTVTNGGLGALNWTAAESPDVSWITLSSASGTSGQAFTVTVNPSSLAPGNYNANISVSAAGASNSPQTLPVSLVVREKDASITTANIYDDTWETGANGWVQHCTNIKNAWSGKVDGFVVQVGDSITYAAPYGSWARYGQGKTTADSSICSWMHADVNGNGTNTTNSGWWLAYYDVPGRGGSYTAKSGIRADQYLAGNYSLPSTDQMFTSGFTNPDGKQYRDTQICILMLGTNDVGANRTSAAFIADLGTIIDKMQAANVIVAVSTLPPRYGSDTAINDYNTQIRSLAQTKKIPLIDFYQEVVRRRPNGTWMNTLISSDGVHPNADYGGSHADSDPYASSGTALSNSGYLLRDWLSVQKVQEIKTKVLGATTWNVSNTAGLQNAVASYASGDSIVLAAGTYNPTNRLTLNRGAVTIYGATGNRDNVVIQGPGMAVNAEPTEMFDLYSDDVTIRDLTIRDVYYHGVHIRGEVDVDRTHLQNLHTLNCGERHFKSSFDTGQPGNISDDILIENCFCEQTQANSNHTDNDYIAGIDLMGVNNLIIRDNVFKGIVGPTGAGRAAIFIWHHNTNPTIERNKIYNCDRGISMSNPGWAGPGPASTGGILRNNLITRGANIALEICFSDSMKVYYNTIYSTDASYWRTVSITDASGIYITNNLQLKYNIFRGLVNNGSVGSGVTETGDITGSTPATTWFADPANGDLHLTAAATPAFNVGVLLPEVPADFDKQNRSSTPDIGADEY